MIISKPQSVNKFYFLDYFYILLRSVSNYSNIEKIFDSFKMMKQKYQLGESKYKKLTIETENLSKTQLIRYRYTLDQVIEESTVYGLITKYKENNLILTDKGKLLLSQYDEKNPHAFYKALTPYMEDKFKAFYYLIDFSYRVNKKRGGLLIFPIYSPLKLGFDRSEIKTTKDIITFANKLKNRLEEDLQEYLNLSLDLSKYNQQLIGRLKDVELLSSENNDSFQPKKYNVIIKRFRDFWINVFLKDIYKYQHSFASFDIWIYRSKQIGIFHVSEFYPNFKGRIVYPTSIITENVKSLDFEKLYSYTDGKSLYLHSPNSDSEYTLDEFVKSLTDSYIDIKEVNRNYFVNLADLRERVCYKMKIATYLFDRFLEKSYKLNLQGNLKINISLEADKLPQETNAMYLKREPVMIDGKYRNIIAIDITRGAKRYARYGKTS